MRRLGERQVVGLEGLLPRHLYRYDLALDRVLDPTDEEGRANGGIGLDSLIGRDWAICQEFGATAHALGVQAIISPSATGVDTVLALFLQHLGLGTVDPHLVEEWGTVGDLAGDEEPVE
ncbi:MAG: hypothetical protein ACRDY2_01395 [Acidimicrobiales bacterium]